VTKTGIGWHCRVCDCFLRDSHTYLDHINGRKHQRSLGYSMRVERSTKEQVMSRLEKLAKEKENESKDLLDPATEENFHDIVKAKDEEARRRKDERDRKRKERKKQAKEEAKQPPEEKEDEETEEVEEEAMDPALAAMMGFSGFGGGNKNR
jgi:U4/U6.U5 tri-snRNP component SNU23